MTSTIPSPFPYPTLAPSFDANLDYYHSKSTPSLSPFQSPSHSSSSEPGLEFDLDSFTHASPNSSLLHDDTFNWDFNPMQSEQMESGSLGVSPSFVAPVVSPTRLITPRTSFSSLNQVRGISPSDFHSSSPSSLPIDTAEALSNHHLQRYLHYKGLASQAEADARASAALQSQQEYDALLVGCSMPSYPFNKAIIPSSAMFGYPSQPTTLLGDTPQYLSYNPQHQANIAHAQADAHLLAHDVAVARAEQQRVQTEYWVAATQNAFSAPPSHFQSVSTGDLVPPHSESSILTPPSITSPALDEFTHLIASTPDIPTSPIPADDSSAADGSVNDEEEIEDQDYQEDEAMAVSVKIPNIKGGGRGYIPGETPEDPSKRHKCSTCGRGFARAYNLKSHLQTHNPVRSKPHQCPHSNCKRGFSRLHDLERHRQGIHNDGPLALLKAAGVSSSTVRAQAKTGKRDSTLTPLLSRQPK